MTSVGSSWWCTRRCTALTATTLAAFAALLAAATALFTFSSTPVLAIAFSAILLAS
ncbi:hypothetical protein Hanom_Chr03g00271341 [Helianthus anomalus]